MSNEVSPFFEVEKVIDTYFKALYECDHETLNNLFDPKARVSGFYEHEHIHQSINEYVFFIRKISSPAMLGEDFNMRILSMNVEGSIACCKVAYLFESLQYKEFLSLLRVDGKWTIISKTFQHD
ncbi:MAG: nuclear transport factor 2 family protein [Pseudomonadales bacterium]|nr:nuclear transport factor 2 family protein [Pseudomonadales bacterium]